MKKQCFNPYLPPWEYVPDGEPHVFGDRVYVYGSHDIANGWAFCLGDYVCWSAPINDLKNWKYEGIIYKKQDDPDFDGRMALYAPDVTKGPDNRYYLYFVFDKVKFVSVAVCDTPAGKYKFYGYVHHKDGTRLGEKKEIYLNLIQGFLLKEIRFIYILDFVLHICMIELEQWLQF